MPLVFSSTSLPDLLLCPPAVPTRKESCAFNPTGCDGCEDEFPLFADSGEDLEDLHLRRTRSAQQMELLNTQTVVERRLAYSRDSSPERPYSRVPVIKLDRGQLDDRRTSLPSTGRDQYWKRACDACPLCTDRCAWKECLRCAIKLQHVHSGKDILGEQQLKEYSICEVVRHRSSDSLWVCANNHVYDATPVLAWHPGGVKLLLKKVGYDATADYNFHSIKARSKVWEPLLIGSVVPCPGCPTYVPPPRRPSWWRTMFFARREESGCKMM
eukprot:Gregarina_sp_Poly_1__1609@NODE_1407_length_4212_cov_129_277684_g937_i0_p2_GENE_NODE_1407_length_4212_cov_129_277684_g937_i0NODE_1407_length_4212_cov_129_277684_g937_i0_p2_ORF_typecomplete_len270_score19_63Cytb5/PF00173_28/1_4e12_NODE_1407_length_4212_cov_129_277684_g937_i030333842